MIKHESSGQQTSKHRNYIIINSLISLAERIRDVKKSRLYGSLGSKRQSSSPLFVTLLEKLFKGYKIL